MHLKESTENHASTKQTVSSHGTASVQTCRECKAEGVGKFCATCGQPYAVKRITLHTIIHEAFHFFTHFDKGFPFTLKKIVMAPGTMQREYIEGKRGRHQKPFSMFFLTASFSALALYWINHSVVQHSGVKESGEVAFFHQYWVLLQICLFPMYALLTYLFFKPSGYNYAEVAILQLYTFSFLFLLLVCIHLLKFLSPNLETRFIELPAIIIYALITNLRFFKTLSKPRIIFTTLITIAGSFLLATFVQDWLVLHFFT